MSKVRIPTLFSAAALLTSFAAAPAAMAASSTTSTTTTSTAVTTPNSLVALGDSITFGYHLPGSDNLVTPSPEAFPYVLGKSEGLTSANVLDTGVPGWTSTDLLNALKSNTYAAKLKQAKIVTIDIGNNDLLHAAQRLTSAALAGKPVVPMLADKLALEAGLAAIKTNLPQIIAAVRAQAGPNTPIVIYNMYNPFVNTTALGAIAESMVSAANHIIAEDAAQSGISVAHAHAAFSGNQANYVLPMDVHPTAAGQDALATAGQDALVTSFVSPSGSDSTGDGSATNPYQTISFAISKAPIGSTVVLEPGTYKESVQITKSVILTSSNPTDPTTVQGTVLDATDQDNGITISGPASSGTVIRGLTVENANNHGIWASDTSNLAILGNVITKNGANSNQAAENKPLLLDGTSYSLVAHNTVSGNLADGGISVTDLGSVDPGASTSQQPSSTTATPAPGNTNWIVSNTVEANAGGCGIVVAAYNPGQGVSGNIIKGNTVSNGVAGIIVAADAPNTSATGNVITGNTVANNHIPGIIVHSNTAADVVSGTLISDNTVSGNGPDAREKLTQTAGVALIGDVTPVTDTVIANNHFSNEYYAVWGSNAVGAVLQNNLADATVTTPSMGVTGLTASQRALFLNGQVTGTFGSSVVHGTTYVPIWYVMSALKSLGITSTWNGHSWYLNDSNAVDTAFSTISQVPGPDGIYFNGTLVQKFTGDAIKDSNSGKSTTYMPLYPLTQVLTALGVQNTWDGTSWQLLAHS